MIEKKDIFKGKRVNTPYGVGIIEAMPYNDESDTVFVELDRPTFDYWPKDRPQNFVVVSFKMMSEVKPQPVPEQIREDRTFRYHAYNFIPAGTFKDFGIKDDFKAISNALETDCILALWKSGSRPTNRPADQPRFEWDYCDFYRVANDSQTDVFYCIETGNFYIPGKNELFRLMPAYTEKWLKKAA